MYHVCGGQIEKSVMSTGNFREYFIFAKSVKRQICDTQSLRLRHDLHVSVNNRLNLLFREDFIFMKLRICEVSGR